ncbi:MAG: glucosidase, partial [Planctomycetota bacterium]
MESKAACRWSTVEGRRVLANPSTNDPWKNWGPYVAEREWGTVREDYSPDGRAWDHFTHDQARSRAYRWGEDGLAAICDRYQTLVFGLALWNHADPFLKERAFGLVPADENHGEDVKEYYHYLDCTPTHSYMRYLYRYPHTRFPYESLRDHNRGRQGTSLPEFELVDTGVFADDRYFDIVVEYAKAAETDIAIRITVCNRGPEPAVLDVIPQLWFRNQWSWEPGGVGKPRILVHDQPESDTCCLRTDSSAQPSPASLPQPYQLPPYYLQFDSRGTALFTENESNAERLWGKSSASRFTKDAFHRYIVDGEPATNPERIGTKAAVHFAAQWIPPGAEVGYTLRLSTTPPTTSRLADVAQVIAQRHAEADEFYAAIHPPQATLDEGRIQRQALAGMLWSKQAYIFDVDRWMRGDDPATPPPPERQHGRNQHWQHLNSMRVLSMPDKWEFPWFAAWDLAFHTIPLVLVDPGFAKEQLWLLLFEQFIHPNGQMPAYEWEFSDVNPPVHAWAVWRVYNMDRISTGEADRHFLESCFHKLLLNFTWWVN